MLETWLQPNRRAIWFGCIPPLLIAAVGGWMAIPPSGSSRNVWNWIGVALVIVACAVLAALVRQLTRPRIAYHDGHVLFNLRSGPPIAVPVEVVEAFFLGQGPANLPGDFRQQEKTVNLVARLAQRQSDWAHRVVKPAFGNWSEGYVTVRGTWCEPLNADVVRRINRRLKEVKSLTERAAADVAT
ncbi:MAG: hypothetical protein L0228_04470 [Planctomycetes bacterium]|nr:hypothetical protein [Planctomycetota bacterium]